jgi:hypothetical protein
LTKRRLKKYNPMKNNKNQKTHKLSDTEFWSALRENGSIFSRTARYIQSKYKITYSRQAVHKRAMATAEAKAELEDIIEEAKDIAQEGLFTLMRTGQPSIRLSAITYFLKHKAKDRGYGDKPMEIVATASTGAAQEQPPTGAGLKLTIKVMGSND